jgi:hypothetical protein
MEREARRRWWIPPQLAFGEKGLPPLVGPNEAVIYDITLQQWEGKPVDTVPLTEEPLGPSTRFAPPVETVPESGPAPQGPALPAPAK